MKRILLLSITLIAVRCAPQHSGHLGTNVEASTAPATAESLQSFQTTVYAFGQMQGCVKCHNANVNPQWMNSNLATAYSFARPLLNLSDPENSLFATYVSNNHCSDPVCADPNNKQVMQDLLLQWATVENSQGAGQTPVNSGMPLSSPPYVTASMPIPTPLPLLTAGTPAVIRFNLSNLTPSVTALNGATLEISIASYNALGTTYKISNLRLVGSTAAVTISGVHVYIRPAAGSGLGSEDMNQGLSWSELSLMAPVFTAPSPLPTGPMTTIPALTNTSLGASSQSAADMITIGFAGIQ